MTGANIKAMLRIEKATLARLIEYGTGAQVPIALKVNYQQVRYQMQKVLDRRAKLDPKFARSLELWGVKIQNDNEPINGFWMERNMELYECGMFVVAFLSQWQLKILRQEGDMVCMDSTHNTCIDGTSKYCYLYTLVVRCRVTGKGKPVCWMITNSESQYPVRFWVEWLKNQFDFIPAKIMIDNSDTEIAAINHTYNDLVDPIEEFTR